MHAADIFQVSCKAGEGDDSSPDAWSGAVAALCNE